MSETLTMTDKTRVRRMPARASYETKAIYDLLDDVPFGTVAFSDGENVHAIPTAIWREDDHLYIHGSNGSRLLQVLTTGITACVSVTRPDGLVLARAAPPHSFNYCSVSVYGVFHHVAPENKAKHMRYFMEHWIPGRWQHTREPAENDLAGVAIMRTPITEAVLKQRSGGPKDKPADMEQAVWAGVVPLQWQWQSPQQDTEQQNTNLPGLSPRKFTQR
jgi:nitroimidazol reductase NimA-like FMN-containing flavoprotein (pyridoxamine 5'-phosphate oxidase superfamily)